MNVIHASNDRSPAKEIINVGAQGVSGARYLLEGFRLLTKKGLRRYALIPIAINLALFVLLTYFFLRLGSDWISSLNTNAQTSQEAITSFSWAYAFWSSAKGLLIWIAWIITGLVLFIAYGFSFNIITNVLAAPFYGLLAEKTEYYLAGTKPPPEEILPMIARVFFRELQKLWYFLSRGLLVFILLLIMSFAPIVNIAVPVLAFLWAAWCLSVQYIDYPADNHRVSFSKLRHLLGKIRWSALSFGSLLTLLAGIPLVNVFVFPAAVAGGSALWVAQRESMSFESAGLK